MKHTKHPELRDIIFKDVVTGDCFLIKSTLNPKETEIWFDGKEYPIVKVEISSKSHPIFNTIGSLDKPVTSREESFNKRYNR